MTVARVFKKFTFSAEDLANLNEDSISEQLISESWDVIKEQENLFQKLDAKKPSFVIGCCEVMANKYQLTGVEIIGKQCFSMLDTPIVRKVTPHFAHKVDKLLPPQPWKPGVRLKIVKEMGCRSSKISDAIQFLIASGKRHRQVDGVVYDTNDEIIAIDLERNDAT